MLGVSNQVLSEACIELIPSQILPRIPSQVAHGEVHQPEHPDGQGHPQCEH